MEKAGRAKKNPKMRKNQGQLYLLQPYLGTESLMHYRFDGSLTDRKRFKVLELLVKNGLKD